MLFKIERCEVPAVGALAAVWPAMRAPAKPDRWRCGSSDSGSSERGRCRRGRSEIPHFPVNCSRLRLFQKKRRKTKKNEKKRRKTKKSEEKRKENKKKEKKKKNEKNGKIPPTPSTPTPLRNSQAMQTAKVTANSGPPPPAPQNLLNLAFLSVFLGKQSSKIP